MNKIIIDLNNIEDSVNVTSDIIYQMTESKDELQLFHYGKLVDTLNISDIKTGIALEYDDDTEAHFTVLADFEDEGSSEDENKSNTTETEEFAIGNMLPQVGLDGKPAYDNKVNTINADISDTSKVSNIIDDIAKDKDSEKESSLIEPLLLTKECVIDYMTIVEREYDDILEESVRDIVLNMKTKVEVSRRIRKLIIDNALKKCKLKTLQRFKADNSKIIQVKREIVDIQKELNKLQKSASAGEKIEIKRIQKEAEKEANKAVAKNSKDKADKATETEESAKPIDAVDNKEAREIVDENKEKSTKKVDAVKARLNDKDEVVPEKCDKCGGKIGLYIKGEPVWLCSKCSKYFGTLKFTEATESTLDEYEFKKEVASMMYETTGEVKYKYMVDGFTYKIENYVETNDNINESVITESFNKNIKALKSSFKSGKKFVKEDLTKIKNKKEDLMKKLKSHNISDTLRANYEAQLRSIREQEDFMREQLRIQQIQQVHQQMAHQAHVDAVNSHALGMGMPGPIMCSAESVDDAIITEARNMEDEIKPIVNSLENKGYMVKYASPGHKKLRKKEDAEPDGVYYNRLYSDARIMFDKKYDFKGCPNGWVWRDVDGCSYLDIVPKTYSEKDGTPDEAFESWKKGYMSSLKDFVDKLPSNNKKSDDKNGDTMNESFKGYWLEGDYMGKMPNGEYSKFENDTAYREAYEEELNLNSESVDNSDKTYDELVDDLFEKVGQ